ncbi:YojF family protein [Paenibacillus lycopersici]|uniref:YojF family protein n=1 Tax=Paenibacillus lycopersici TaxID=2704462 RepID=A0A6C0G3S2_9BACL|nr:YojF family protein [Paenibacillus lycopersici]QHT59425.1 YojF family protein [Paenibacillus lycopersici]
MKLIDRTEIQRRIDRLQDQELYLHLEMTTGAYASHLDSSKHPAATFVTNTIVRYSHGSISGGGPYRVGLKMAHGWVYSEGLTHYEERETERLILAGHDGQGKLVVALQLSREPF